MSPLLVAVVAGLVVCQVANLVTTIWLHRTLSHRGLTVRPWLHATFRVVIWLTTGLRPRQWVAVHRLHHAYTDVEGDPHSPVLLGTARVQWTNPVLYRRALSDPELLSRYAKDMRPDRWDRVLFDHGLLGVGLGTGLLVVLLGPAPGLLAAGVHAVSYLLLSAAVNALGHSYGRRPFANTATNLQWLALLTAGEGLHNNHHAVPTSPRLAVVRREIDPGWWVIRVLHVLGWAQPRRLSRGVYERTRAPSAAA